MISVCLASYNGEKYIHQQVESILAQLSDVDELVISDDQSTDKTIDIIRSFQDKRIKLYIHDKKEEKVIWDYSTRNFENALIHAKGDIIFLSDQDDVFLPGKVEQMSRLLKNPFDLVICNCKICDSELNDSRNTYFEANVTKSYFDAFTRFRMLGCCMAFRKELLQKSLPFPKTKVGHDLWLFLMAKHYGNIVYVNEPLHLFRRHEDSVTTCGNKSNYSFLFRVYYRLYIVKSFLSRIIFGE